MATTINRRSIPLSGDLSSRSGSLSASKAAALSGAMLTRRKSSIITNQQSVTAIVAPLKGRESVTILAEMLNIDPTTARQRPSEILKSGLLEDVLKLACLASMVSVCLNTPHTISFFPPLFYVIIMTDAIATVLFLIEAIIKVATNGLIAVDKSYLRDRWCQFEFFLLVLHLISLSLDVYQLITIWFPQFGLQYHQWYCVVRSPRPFVMIRFIRSVVRFQLPKNRIQQIIKRSSQQIQNVTIFFMFFMAFYAIMGVQLFGRMDYHCVLPGTNVSNVTIADLAIPDTMCSQKGAGGYECPGNMECVKLDMSAHAEGFYGMFNDFGTSLFTVYLAASQEGWVYVLYDCLDTFPSYIAFFYFVTLIFFLAWLVKAFITETFAEIRVQFSEMWQTRECSADDSFSQKLEKTDEGWRLVAVDADKSATERSTKLLYNIVRSTPFQIAMMILVLLNAIFNASFVHKHDGSDESRKLIYYYIEVAFTLLFNIECSLKIFGFGWHGYIRRGLHKFELILCIGSTLNIIKPLYSTNVFTYFQVFRIVRLIRASPMLEDFVYKIFGPGKKLGGLVIFTVVLLVITSAVSLQLFCYVPNLDKFRTFPQAFMSMFQIITQEGWTDVVVEILRTTNESMVPFVAIYFVGYHLFVTLIVLSLFVAVILDNLEMDEELKKVKQLKAREETTMRTTLPWRLRIFDKFPTRPQMVELRRVSSEFPLPKVRQSFTRQFAENETFALVPHNQENDDRQKLLFRNASFIRSSRHLVKLRQIGQLSSKWTVATLVEESNRNRALLSDSTQFIAQLGRTGTALASDSTFARLRNRSINPALKLKAMYEQLKENGDVRPADSAPKNELKQGEIDIKALQQKRQHAELTRNRIEEEIRENHPFFDRPLFAVGRDSRLRRICQEIVYAKYLPNKIDPVTGKQIQRRYKQLHSLVGLMTYLDWAMVFITSVSCVSMLFESPWPTTGENLIFNNPYLQICEYLFVISMTFELAVKILANGFFFTPNAVIRDVGGVMTLFIYITSMIYLMWMPNHVEINSLAQFMMIFRAMRPLRIYVLVPHVRSVVVELCKGFKKILLVTILLIALMFIFASFGVQIVGGKLAACNDPNITEREKCVGIFEQKIFVTRMEVFGKDDDELHPKIWVPRVWSNPRNFNFDHIGNAMLALFETLSYKGWNVIRDILWMREGPWAVLFIHIYVFLGCMIGLTLFVGVVIANYTENRGTALLTVDQRRWHDLKARLKMAQPLHVPPKPAESAKLRRYLYEITMSRWFKQAFAILVVVNSATLVIPWNVEEEENSYKTLLFLTGLSALANILFTVEILLKMIAFTVSGFWESRRNRIDMLITILGLFWIVTHFVMALPASAVQGQSGLKKYTYTFGYMVVILRFFTIAGRKSTLKMLMLTVVMSMVRSLFIITAMFLLVLFYAYAGVILFGMVKYGQAVSKHVNFRSGKEALVVLFRSVTGEDWNDIMHDCMRSPPLCYYEEGINYWQTDCGNYFGAIIYFCSFYLIITYIVLNLLVAVIIENFSLFYSSEEDALLSYADIRNFQQVWNMVDVEQKRTIPVRRVKFLLRLLKGRLEVDPNKDRLLFKHMCYEMVRLHNGDDISFHDILNMLSYRSVDIRKSLQLEELLQREELEYIIEEEVAKQTIRSWLESCLRRIKAQQTKDVPLIAQLRPLLNQQHNLPSMLQLNQVTNQLNTQEASEKTNDVIDTEDEDVLRRRTVRKSRRSSIPELVGEAKKFIFSSGMSAKQKSLQSDRPGSVTDRSKSMLGTGEKTAGSNPVTRAEKRSTLKALQMPTYELPDLEEKGEDNDSYVSCDRRHSAEAALLPTLNNDSTNAATKAESSSLLPDVFGGAIQDSTPDIKGWWGDLNSGSNVF
uniref:Sodium leak channel NALCN n=1 Tax=Anisakis simplex TaxID=6269 RepID=A0A346RVM0_ANISI|nr:Sodium leak channel non-selective protein [Anisakis simplex]